MHRTVLDLTRGDPERIATEALVSLYRRSQFAGDRGRIFLVRTPTELGLLRTEDAQDIASILLWRDLFNASVREVTEGEITQLCEVI
jgi:hypothetical protein